MTEAIQITEDRRKIQQAYNDHHGITPQTIVSSIKEIGLKGKKVHDIWEFPEERTETTIKRLELEMDIASANLDFELAGEIRDELIELRKRKTH